MKKLFVSFAISCMILIAGVTLASCGKEYTNVAISVDAESDSLMQLVVKVDGKEIEGRGYNFNIETGSNVRVELVAKEHGVDFSEATVTVNGVGRSIIKNRDYDMAYGSEDLVYGNFTLPNLDEDLSVVVSGVKQISITYDFDVQNVEDETAIANMKLAYIDPDGDGGYESLYDFVTNPESKITREYSAENFNSFKIIFGRVENGAEIFDLTNSTSVPFKLRDSDGVEQNATYSLMSSGEYVVTLPDVTEQSYTIVVDFADLKYQEFSITVPDDNLNFSVTAPVSLNYFTGGEIVVAKSAVRDSLVYDNMKVFLNDLELQLDPECDVAEDSNLIFLIPENITPISTSMYGEVYYTLRVEGIEYNAESYEVSIVESQNPDVLAMMSPSLCLVGDNGENLGEIPKQDGKYVVVKGEKVALFWEYNLNSQNQIISKYDLYDFDIQMGDIVLVEETPTPEEPTEEPVEQTPEVLSDEGSEQGTQEPEDTEDGEEEEIPTYETVITTLSIGGKLALTGETDEVVELADGYNLRAIYDASTGRFDSLQLEFSCENDKEISFSNFKIYSEDILVTHDVEDGRFSSVEFAVISEETLWSQLEKGSQKQIEVEVGQVVAFRLVGSTYALSTDFGVTDNGLVEDEVEVVTYNQGENYYTEYRFKISPVQFTTTPELKFIAK